ncbi:MAG: hypothetical protein QG596_1026 [Actinomycetota bacterium]|jgi:hypothetical protein|nr:hypothetical protein [Actinomycetota bacterium]
MMPVNSGRNPLILGAILIIVAIALFLILKPDDSDKSEGPVVTNNSATEQPEEKQKQTAKAKLPPVPTVVVRNGEAVDGVLGIEVDKGEQITFRVESDVDEEIHVHGFDITKEIAAGGTARLSFPADITGIYETELEYSGIPIVELQINP